MHRQPLRLPRLQPLPPGIGDHGTVVGAERRPRVEHPATLVLHQLRQAGAQTPVRPHPAGDHQPAHADLADGAAALDGHGVHHGILEGTGNVRPVLLCLAAVAPGVQGKGLQSAEAEIEAGAIDHGTREIVAVGIAALRELRQRRSARVGQAKQLGRLVEGLADRVVHRVAEHPVAPHAVDLHDHAVAAGDQQGQERELRGIRLQHGRQQVPFHMMNGDRRHTPGPGEAAPGHRPDQQGADQARPGRVGHAVDTARLHTGLVEHFFHQRQ